ncbi:CRISPR-associated endonuclease Cas2 [Desulfurispirillum indicum]|uniref:CRISPR-associated endonuclease Cas2 n=1 Tax=Desulfurispirillum indicum TaxID=936456 RepID=UPI001CF952A6|nr:CRISPR-associated endonuclease Cas2 [Desulfurispirillum indicum]UCZ57496.1 CRISPR-associated endonuclease Cas2 [Desulfurispirillum indicum]
MWVLVAYDVSTEDAAGRKRLRRVAKACEKYGQRVQKSLFECQVDSMTLEKLRAQLLMEIRVQEDNLRIYHLGNAHDKVVEQYGATRTIDFQEPLIL